MKKVIQANPDLYGKWPIKRSAHTCVRMHWAATRVVIIACTYSLWCKHCRIINSILQMYEWTNRMYIKKFTKFTWQKVFLCSIIASENLAVLEALCYWNCPITGRRRESVLDTQTHTLHILLICSCCSRFFTRWMPFMLPKQQLHSAQGVSVLY